jgi:hypothetical protein
MVSSFVRRRLLAGCALITLASVALPEASVAQPALRSSFPGRRIGGGTRGECSARFLANLVPASSVFAPGANQLIGVLQGPSATTYPLLLSFAPYTPGAPAAAGTQRVLPPLPAALVLVKAPALKGPTSWESTFRCPDASGAPGAGDLDFVQRASPPALSLLVPQAEATDLHVQTALQTLHQACGSKVPLAAVVKAFNLPDALGSEWPQQLPVHCP